MQKQVQPGQGVVHAESRAHDLGDAGQRPELVRPAARGRPASSSAANASGWPGLGRQRAPPEPLEASSGRPPAARALGFHHLAGRHRPGSAVRQARTSPVVHRRLLGPTTRRGGAQSTCVAWPPWRAESSSPALVDLCGDQRHAAATASGASLAPPGGMLQV